MSTTNDTANKVASFIERLIRSILKAPAYMLALFNFVPPTPHYINTSQVPSQRKTLPGTVFIPVEQALSALGEANQIAQLAKVILLLLLRGLIAPCEVLLRYQIGERYFSIPVTAACAAVFLLPTNKEFMPVETGLMIFAVYIAGASLHMLFCFVRDRVGGYWHSYNEGQSWFSLESVDYLLTRLNFTFDFAKLVIEPFLFFVLGVSLQVCLGDLTHQTRPLHLHPLAQYCLTASFGLLAHQLYCWRERRKMILDEKDALVIADARALANTASVIPEIRKYRGVAFTRFPAQKIRWEA